MVYFFFSVLVVAEHCVSAVVKAAAFTRPSSELRWRHRRVRQRSIPRTSWHRPWGFDSVLLLQEILEEGIVKELGSLGLREHGPQQKGQLEGVVEGDPVKEEIGEG